MIAMPSKIIPAVSTFESTLMPREGSGELPIEISPDDGLTIAVGDVEIKIGADREDEPIFVVSVFKDGDMRAMFQWLHLNTIDIDRVFLGAKLRITGGSLWVGLVNDENRSEWTVSFSEGGWVQVWGIVASGSMQARLTWIKDGE